MSASETRGGGEVITASASTGLLPSNNVNLNSGDTCQAEEREADKLQPRWLPSNGLTCGLDD